MTSRRSGKKVWALCAVGALGLSACSTGGGEAQSTESGSSDATITMAHEQEFSAYNNTTSGNNAVKNAVVLNQVVPSFWEWGPKGAVRRVEDFGTYSKTSDDPLTVEYKVAEKAIWSDDDPLDCDDFYLQWMAQSGKFAAGNFTPASTTGFDRMQPPQCEEGDKNVKIVFDQPYADWETAFGGPGAPMMPAHIVEKQTGVASIVEAAKANNPADLEKIGTFWNNGWTLSPGELKPDITPSSGPYMLDSWKAGESITLKANPKWWGTPARTGTIVVKFIDQTAQAQALQNGDVQVAQPQPNTDVLNQLKKAGEEVTVLQGDEYSFEHLDFNFERAFADPTLRKAFARCVPRDKIVNDLIKPVNADAKPMDARLRFPFEPGFDAYVKALGVESYSKPNLDEAKQLMAGKPKVDVRIGYIAGNPRRASQVALIKESCDQAGFNVIDAANPNFFESGQGLEAGDFDVALYAWQGSSLVVPNVSIYKSGGGQNHGGAKNPQVDALLDQLAGETDSDKQVQILQQVDKLLWDDLATIPLFTFPSLVGYSSAIDGVVAQPAQSQISWNMQEWALKS